LFAGWALDDEGVDGRYGVGRGPGLGVPTVVGRQDHDEGVAPTN
jgi:hypothetical protein